MARATRARQPPAPEPSLPPTHALALSTRLSYSSTTSTRRMSPWADASAASAASSAARDEGGGTPTTKRASTPEASRLGGVSGERGMGGKGSGREEGRWVARPSAAQLCGMGRPPVGFFNRAGAPAGRARPPTPSPGPPCPAPKQQVPTAAPGQAGPGAREPGGPHDGAARRDGPRKHAQHHGHGRPGDVGGGWV